MKKIIIILALFAIAMPSYCQPFEGTITWRVPDPAGKVGASSIVLKVKGNTIITVINGGMMNGAEMWFMNNDTKIMRVMRPQKMFVVVPPEAMAAAAQAVEATKFVKTAETTKILNYTCTKYTGEMKARGVTTKVAIWTTTEIKDDLKVLAHQPDPFGNPKLPEGVEGVPLKIEKTDPKGTAVMEVTEVKPEKLSDDLFKVPADFKEMGK
jgi:hypothetical protein